MMSYIRFQNEAGIFWNFLFLEKLRHCIKLADGQFRKKADLYLFNGVPFVKFGPGSAEIFQVKVASFHVNKHGSTMFKSYFSASFPSRFSFNQVSWPF